VLFHAQVVAETAEYGPLLEAMVQISQRERARGCPSLLDHVKGGRGVWAMERGAQTLRSAAQTCRIGWGDCKHYSVWLAADIRHRGDRDARVIVRYVRAGLYHALVVDGDGKVRDPSKILGMKGGRKW
jgi:hypothetical protein